MFHECREHVVEFFFFLQDFLADERLLCHFFHLCLKTSHTVVSFLGFVLERPVPQLSIRRVAIPFFFLNLFFQKVHGTPRRQPQS